MSRLMLPGVVVMLLGALAPAVAAETGDAGADVLAGPNIRVSGAAATDSEYQSAGTYNSVDDEYLVVWMDTRNLSTRGLESTGSG